MNEVLPAQPRLDQAVPGALLPAALRATLLSTVTALNACAPFEDAQSIEPYACASRLTEVETGDGEDELDEGRSDKLALTRNGYDTQFGTRGELSCTVQAYTAYDPDSLENFTRDEVSDLLQHWIVGFMTSVDEEGLDKVKMRNSCSPFDENMSDDENFCVAVCPEWTGDSYLWITEGCEELVSIDGQLYDTLPASAYQEPEEEEEEHEAL